MTRSLSDTECGYVQSVTALPKHTEQGLIPNDQLDIGHDTGWKITVYIFLGNRQ